MLTNEALSDCYRELSAHNFASVLEEARIAMAFENKLLELTLHTSAHIIQAANLPAGTHGDIDVLDRAVRTGGLIAYFGLQIATEYNIPIVHETAIDRGFAIMDGAPSPKDKIWEDLVTDKDKNMEELIGTALNGSPLMRVDKFLHIGAGCVLFFTGIQAGHDMMHENAWLS